MRNSSIETTPYEWVVGRFYGDMQKHVNSMIKEGTGYYKIGDGKDQRGEWVNAAFRRPKVGPTPSHLTVVMDRAMLNRLDKKVDTEREDRRTPKTITQSTLKGSLRPFKGQSGISYRLRK